VVQNLNGGTEVTTVAGANQVVPGGPVASQESIKELGTNGGGFYNANSAHPFENPNGISNFVQMFLITGHPLRPHVHPRAFGQEPQTWAGGARCDVHPLVGVGRPGHGLRDQR